MMHRINKKGFSLVEVLIAASIITASILSIVGVYTAFYKNSFDNAASLQSTYLAEEGIEAMNTMRDSGWTGSIGNLAVGTAYHLYFNAGLSKWQATTSTAMIDNTFDRTFTLSNAYRDASDNLAVSGTVDPNSRLLTVNVSWKNRTATSTETIQTYISNLFSN